MTTAQHREAARAAEKALKWQDAADAWGAAIASYRDLRGALAQRDLANMETRRATALRMAAA